MANKYMGKYNELSLSSWIFRVMFDDWSKTMSLSEVVLNVCRGNVWDSYK